MLKTQQGEYSSSNLQNQEKIHLEKAALEERLKEINEENRLVSFEIGVQKTSN